MDAKYLKAPKILFFEIPSDENNFFLKMMSMDEISSVQKLDVPVLFFTITAVHGSLKFFRFSVPVERVETESFNPWIELLRFQISHSLQSVCFIPHNARY